MLFLGNASGHDLPPHLALWTDVAGQWREGIVFPRWAEWANWGYGAPNLIFYPPASPMLGGALGSVLPWRIVPGALIFLTLVTAGMAMWTLARQWLSQVQAVGAAMFFAANPYHLVMIYYRSDFSELLASAIFPLMIYGAVKVVRKEWQGGLLLAGSIGAIWLSNAPAGVIATYSLVLLLVVGCALQRSLDPLIFGGAGMAAGFSLAAFYIVPAAWEQRWIQIGEAIDGRFVAEKNFLFTQATYPDYPWFQGFNWKVSGIAVGVMVFTASGIVFSRHRRRDSPQVWWMLVILAFASAFLMFPLSGLLWKYLPKLGFLQFPWRWLMPLGLVFSFFVAAAMPIKRTWVWLLAIIIAIGATAVTITRDTSWSSKDVPTVAEEFRSGEGYQGIEGFEPFGSDIGQLPDDKSRVTKWYSSDEEADADESEELQVDVQQWTAERKIFSTQVTEPTTIALHLLNYPAWEGRVDDHAARLDSDPDNGQMLIRLDKGTHRVEVVFRRTWDRTAGAVISLVSVVALIVIALYLLLRDNRSLQHRKVTADS
jgi:hypothetical protein